MDGQRFDALARALSKGVSRRTVWRGAIGAAAGWLALPIRNSKAQEGCGTGFACPAGRDCVDGLCCDSQDACCGPGFGLCADGIPCCDEPTFTCCNGICTVLAEDAQNCGTCGNTCGEGSVCCAGVCCDQATNTCCFGACNPTLDPRNCGGCGGEDCGPCGVCVEVDFDFFCSTTCAGNEFCDGGVCVSCPPGQLNCFGGCTDVLADPNNCGTCGHLCDDFQNTGTPYGTICVEGNCVCPDGEHVCSFGDEEGCVNTSSNPRFCGSCDNDCWVAQAGAVCISGTCQCPDGGSLCGDICCPKGGTCDGGICTCPGDSCDCPNGTYQCAGRCINFTTDPQNCGGCGSDCGPGGICESGGCYCPYTQCEFGRCYDTQTDPTHCGSCDTACADGEVCVDGACVVGGVSGEPTPVGNPAPGANPSPTPNPGVTDLPSTGAGTANQSSSDGRLPLLGAGAAIGAAAVAWLRGRVPKDEEA